MTHKFNSATIQIQMDVTAKLLKEADSFIKSVNQFNKKEQASLPQSGDSAIPPSPDSEDKASASKLIFPANFSFGAWPTQNVNPRAKFITFIESFYFRYKKLPVKEDFLQNFPPSDLPSSLTDWKTFLLDLQEPLENRGIPVYEVETTFLEPRFVLAVNLIVNHYDRRSVQAKLKEAGLTTKQWLGLMQVPRLREYYTTRLNDVFDEDTQLEAKLQLKQLVATGDLQAIKYYHELKRIHQPVHNSNQLVITMLQVIMEILGRYVTPDVLSKVANEIRSSNVIDANTRTELTA